MARNGSEQLLAHYRVMRLIRTVENSLVKLFADGEIPGFIHLSIGQEAIAAGVVGALDARDSIATTHRGHGHVIARGLDLDLFYMELMGRQGGVCAGRGGSMHVADRDLGILGANGIVGAGIPIAMGAALAHAVRKTGGVSAVFFGDGAMAEGVLHESLNMASLWKLPMIFVCENNGWSEFSPTSRQFAGRLGGLCAAFDLEHRLVDGNDVEAVSAAATELVARARQGGARVLECKTHRVRGHYEGDPQKYRPDEDAGIGADLDPLKRCTELLAQRGVAAKAIAEIDATVEARVAAAIEKARADAPPDFDRALADVYTAVAAGS